MDPLYTMQCNAMQCNAMQCNTIQYNTIVYWHSPGGAFQWQCDEKLIKIREVVNNSIKKERVRWTKAI